MSCAGFVALFGRLAAPAAAAAAALVAPAAASAQAIPGAMPLADAERPPALADQEPEPPEEPEEPEEKMSKKRKLANDSQIRVKQEKRSPSPERGR